MARAWPAAQRGSLPADLPDGSPYEPELFLDAKISVGTAQTPDGRSLRLVVRQKDGSVRQLRRLPFSEDPSFDGVTASGGVLVWMEGAKDRRQIWAVDLGTRGSPRRLTADTGDVRFYDSQYDLVVADQRVHWVAAGAGDRTEVRSVPLGGGPVQVLTEAGIWGLTAWPWLVDGIVAAAGTTVVKNVVTGRELAVPSAARAVTDCSPIWCRVVSLADDGYTRIELMRPDGTDRRKVADGAVATLISDVAVLDRFEVLARITASSELTGNQELLVYDIRTGRTVQVSPDAGNVVYRGGVLSWSTGTRESFLRHAVDLRTV